MIFFFISDFFLLLIAIIHNLCESEIVDKMTTIELRYFNAPFSCMNSFGFFFNLQINLRYIQKKGSDWRVPFIEWKISVEDQYFYINRQEFGIISIVLLCFHRHIISNSA